MMLRHGSKPEEKHVGFFFFLSFLTLKLFCVSLFVFNQGAWWRGGGGGGGGGGGRRSGSGRGRWNLSAHSFSCTFFSTTSRAYCHPSISETYTSDL